MASSRVAGGLTQSSSSSGIFFQGDGQSKGTIKSHLGSSYGNSSNSIPGAGHSNFIPVSGDTNNGALNSVASSGPSVGASSLVTDANSALSGGPHLQRSPSMNAESYMRLPTSPMSFSSNNMGISGASLIDASSVVQHNPQQDHNAPQLPQTQPQARQVSPGDASLSNSQTAQASLPMAARVSGSLMTDPNSYSQLQKKPRLDIKQDDFLQQQMLQQLLQRQDSMQLQGRNTPQLQAALFQQQQRLRQQQQMFQSLPPLQRAHLQQQQQIQLRQQLQQQAIQPVNAMKRPHDGGVCARRLMQYLYHQRQRPADNSIAYWRKFVTEYYSPRAKKRWCLSLYNNVGHHALGVFPQAAMDAWQCDICGSKSGRGFEASFEVLPRLNEIKFGSGVIDELLFLDMPREIRYSSGIMMLEYGKAVQESVYEQLRVVREGQLRIIFTHELKILAWEFCARRHEELLPRRLVAPQVNQLVQVAQKCQSTIAEGGSDGASQQDLQANSNMVLTAGQQLAKSLELQSLNDLGFSKRYVRCLQISEVVNSMKDLIDFCKEQKTGPVEGLKSYPQHATAKLQMQKMQEIEQVATAQGLPTDRNTLSRMVALHPGLDSQMNSQNQLIGRGALSGSAQAALALSSYQNLLMRQSSMNSTSSNPLQQETTSFNNSNHQSPSSSFHGTTALSSAPMQSLPGSGLSSPNLPPPQQSQQSQVQQQLHQRPNANNLLVQNHPQTTTHGNSNNNQAMQHQMIQQLLQISNNSGGGQQRPLPGSNMKGGSMTGTYTGFGGSSSVVAAGSADASGSNTPAPTRSSSLKNASAGDVSAAAGSRCSEFNQRTADLPQNLHLDEDIIQDIAHDFTENGFFNSDLDDNMCFAWKG
ncbi:probable transcriptional regulator SLK2 [Cucurbita maxima]|uniref:Probable transcriptional regulator SLK2 n=1 Tax=Cucurbita maxima TaxID=3661 RepID=A0A6J1HYM4_CUCMA|nr:probable transcriptional regulator SLK2 [Cucurbita maxima]XP_022969731.1 probable transcriptional regulator SLK2 [Cucurbita maxima]